MSYSPLEAPPVSDDTPVDERPPYGDLPRWPYVVLIIVVLVLAAVFVARRLGRRARRRFAAEPAEVITMYPSPDQSYAGTWYRIEFYDGDYRQLADEHRAVILASPFGPDADAALDSLARALAAEVEARDGQRCFRPRVVLYGAAGRRIRVRDVIV